MIDLIDKIESKADFVYFLNLLSKHFEQNPDEWENKTIPSFPEQMAARVEDYSVSPANDIKRNAIQFRSFAQILYMGKM
jgi:hypothetical protein